MNNNKLVYITLSCSLIICVIFYINPEFDIKITKIFFDDSSDNSRGFYLKDEFIAVFLYKIIPLMTKLFALLYSAFLCYKYYASRNLKSVLNNIVFFLFLSAIIGPGFFVNTILKDHMGRARPREIVEFHGEKQYTKPFTPSNQCNKNCSFPSGHAAMAFYFTSIAYIATSNSYFSIIYILSIIFGILVGASRIIMGAHFTSDVVASCFIILATNHIIFILWKKFQLTSTK